MRGCQGGHPYPNLQSACARGEWYFIAQLVLFGLILLAPLAPGQPAWPSPLSLAARGLGLLLGLAGFAPEHHRGETVASADHPLPPTST